MKTRKSRLAMEIPVFIQKLPKSQVLCAWGDIKFVQTPPKHIS